MMKHQVISVLRACLSVCLLIFLLVPNQALSAKAEGGKGGGNRPNPVESTPLALSHERYFFRIAGEDACLGEDDELDWGATGSLEPGESFSFTPEKAACYAHPAAITVLASWESGELEISSEVPDADYSSWDEEQFGRQITAPVVGNHAQLCMFPEFSSDGVNYTITVTNSSSETVSGIDIHGRHENDWPVFYHSRCMNADADSDGWNDSLEHTMANLVYPNAYQEGVNMPNALWGSNYLRPVSRTPQEGDEVDSYPPDFNDDGQVDDTDLAILEVQSGQGNGIPLQQISPNPGPGWYKENTLIWRRFDLDGDGFVSETDRQVMLDVLHQSVPMRSDIVFPTARVLQPASGTTVPKGTSVQIVSHAWDNSAIESVDYLVNGRAVCSNTEHVSAGSLGSPLYYCWWRVPKKNAIHRLEVVVTDRAGQSTISEAVLVGVH